MLQIVNKRERRINMIHADWRQIITHICFGRYGKYMFKYVIRDHPIQSDSGLSSSSVMKRPERDETSKMNNNYSLIEFIDYFESLLIHIFFKHAFLLKIVWVKHT